MKHTLLAFFGLFSLLSMGCDQKKASINKANEATKDAIDDRKAEVNTAAKEAIKETKQNAEIDKARIDARKDSIQAQLDADKKKADAAADAAKAKVDAEE